MNSTKQVLSTNRFSMKEVHDLVTLKSHINQLNPDQEKEKLLNRLKI